MEGRQIFRGTLKSYSPKDGYGFISCPILSDAFGRDVYINHSRLPVGAAAGSRVDFTLTISNKGQPQAQHVLLVRETPEEPAEVAQASGSECLQAQQDIAPQDTSCFCVMLDKRKPNFRLGIDVDTTQGLALLVDAVTGGLVEEWNRLHPDLQVRAGDQIVEVNGISGDAQAIFKECRHAQHLEMRIRHGTLEQQQHPQQQASEFDKCQGAS